MVSGAKRVPLPPAKMMPRRVLRVASPTPSYSSMEVLLADHQGRQRSEVFGYLERFDLLVGMANSEGSCGIFSAVAAFKQRGAASVRYAGKCSSLPKTPAA